MNALLAADAWPGPLDWVALALFFGLAIVLPAAGWVVMCRDLRRWLRSLRGALVVVARHLPGVPIWARRETPRCVAALGLRMPCTVEDLKQAYRHKAKQLHPDLGGDQQRFLWFQSQFEQALAIVDSRRGD